MQQKKGKCPPSRSKHQHLYQIIQRKEIKIQKEGESEKRKEIKHGWRGQSYSYLKFKQHIKWKVKFHKKLNHHEFCQ